MLAAIAYRAGLRPASHFGTTLMRILSGRTRGTCVTMLALFCASLSAAPEEYEGRPLARIEFDPPQQPLSAQILIGMLPLKTGEPLRAVAVREAIQKLYSTGEYADIAADATLDQDRVVLR